MKQGLQELSLTFWFWRRICSADFTFSNLPRQSSSLGRAGALMRWCVPLSRQPTWRRSGWGWDPSSLLIQLLMRCKIRWLGPCCLRDSVGLPANQGWGEGRLLLPHEATGLIPSVRFYLQRKKTSVRKGDSGAGAGSFPPRWDLSGCVAPSITAEIASAPGNCLEFCSRNATPPPPPPRLSKSSMYHETHKTIGCCCHRRIRYIVPRRHHAADLVLRAAASPRQSSGAQPAPLPRCMRCVATSL